MSKLLVILCFIVASANAWTKDLTVMFGDSRPPFISKKPPLGISYELFELISSRLGWQFSAQFAPNKRMEHELSDMQVDVIVEVQKSNPDAFYSAPFLAYHNFAVTRSQDKISFSNFSDLKHRSVCAWQNAIKNLGPAFANEVPNFSAYKEFPHQEDQVRYWLAKQCEVILIDDTLLKWWVNTLSPSFHKRNRAVDKDLVYAPLPNNTLWWYVAFSDEENRDHFNTELRKIRANKEYDIIRKQVLIED